MQKRLVLLASYLLLLPCVLLALTGSLIILIHMSAPKHMQTLTSDTTFQEPPKQTVATSYVPENREARVQVLTEFFKRYDSPLLGHAQEIIDAADKYAIDWRLIPAIAMQESTLCKKVPKNSNNCWGFGIYGGKITRFKDYDEAIEIVTKTLAKDYKEQRGLEHPNEIVTRYTPGSETWAGNVNYVMDKIQASL